MNIELRMPPWTEEKNPFAVAELVFGNHFDNAAHNYGI